MTSWGFEVCRSVVFRSENDTWLRAEFQTVGESGETCSCPSSWPPGVTAHDTGALVGPLLGVGPTHSWPFCFPRAVIFKLLLSLVRTPANCRRGADMPRLQGERPSLSQLASSFTPPRSTPHPDLTAIPCKIQTRLWPHHELLPALRRVPITASWPHLGPQSPALFQPLDMRCLGVPFPVISSPPLLRRLAHMSHRLVRPH